MTHTPLNETELKDQILKIYKEERISIFIERYEKLSLKDKKVLKENLNLDKKTLTEATGWNTFFDVVGWFDPTGLVDVGNGISYMYQGDYFFGMLSMVAAIPLVGDIVAKPLIGLGKGSKLIKGMDEALLLAKNGKTAEASIALEKASQNPMVRKFTQNASGWGPKLKEIVENVPLLPKGMKRTIIDWIELFTKGGTKVAQSRRVVGGLASKVAKMHPDDAVKAIKNMKDIIKADTKIFKNFKPENPTFMAKYFWPGATVGLLWRNRALSGLVSRTKFYAGFLDWLGLGNWVGPEELANMGNQEELNNKFQQYASSPEGQQNWSEDFGGVPGETTTQMTPQPVPVPSQETGSGVKNDIVTNILTGLFLKGL